MKSRDDPNGDWSAAALSCIAGHRRDGSGIEVLRDGFDGPDFAESGGLYYRENSEQSAGSVEFQNDVKRTGRRRAQAQRQAACAAHAVTAAANAPKSGKRPRCACPTIEGVWYGFAVKFADPIPRDDHRYLIAQWKREIDPGAEGDFSPFLALRLRKGSCSPPSRPTICAPDAGRTRTARRHVRPARRRSGSGRKPTRCARWSPPTRVWTPDDGDAVHRLHRRDHR